MGGESDEEDEEGEDSGLPISTSPCALSVPVSDTMLIPYY